MNAILVRLKNEPALLLGLAFSAVVAVAQYAGGHDLIGQNAVDAIAKAFDPQTGWAIPLILGIVTRFFVSPASKVGL